MSPQKLDFFNGSRKKTVWYRDLKIWDSSIYPSTKKSEGVIYHPPIQICLILK